MCHLLTEEEKNIFMETILCTFLGCTDNHGLSFSSSTFSHILASSLQTPFRSCSSSRPTRTRSSLGATVPAIQPQNLSQVSYRFNLHSETVRYNRLVHDFFSLKTKITCSCFAHDAFVTLIA
mgnify:CR=1 FL=1